MNASKHNSNSKTSKASGTSAGGSELDAGCMDSERQTEETVVVRRQWNHWMHGTVRLNDIDHPHWDDYSGGFQARAPRPFIHAYISCNAFVSGEVGHSCAHGAGPHRIKVCIVKKDNTPGIFWKIKMTADKVAGLAE
jgi:hypothetical protein